MLSHSLRPDVTVLGIAIGGGVVTLLGLILLEAFQRRRLALGLLVNHKCAGVLYGLAVVSLIWEFVVRRDHSTDLRHYLRLDRASRNPACRTCRRAPDSIGKVCSSPQTRSLCSPTMPNGSVETPIH